MMPADGDRGTVLDLLAAGGPVMVPIGLCTVFVVTSWIERSFAIRSARIAARRDAGLSGVVFTTARRRTPGDDLPRRDRRGP